MVDHCTDQIGCLKGDWMSLPSPSWRTLTSKFTGLNGHPQLSEEKDEEHVDVAPAGCCGEGPLYRPNQAPQDYPTGSRGMTGNAQCGSLGASDEPVEQEIIKRIQTISCHCWDPLGGGEVFEGGYVLANCCCPGDNGDQAVHACARGLILKCAEDRTCHIAFLDKGGNRLTRVTMQLPDPRFLHPIDDGNSSDQLSE